MRRAKVNFKTPAGLKIRLNHRYFFYQITGIDRYCTEDEIVNNDTMYNAVAKIESMYLVPTMLIQGFALFAVIFHMSVSVFFASSVALYIFGCIWRFSKQDFLLNRILTLFAAPYATLWWLYYIALVVLVFVLDSTYLIAPYVIARLICFVFDSLQNHLIANFAYKKYGVPFNDTEICAFRVFHKLSKSSLKLSDYIELYVLHVHGEEAVSE